MKLFVNNQKEKILEMKFIMFEKNFTTFSICILGFFFNLQVVLSMVKIIYLARTRDQATTGCSLNIVFFP